MAAENTHTFSSSISLTMRSIQSLCAFIASQNSSSSQTLDEETKLGIIKRIDDLTQQATVIVQAPLKALEEQCFKPLKKCQKCGKLKIAGRQVRNMVDAVRRFQYFGNRHQQPSETALVSDSDNEDGYSRIQQKSIAIVQQWQSSQATTMEDETRQQSEWEDVQGAEKILSRRNRKTQRRKGDGGSKKVGPRRQSYDNSWNDVILAPTLMHCDPEEENLGSSSDSSAGSGSGRSGSSASYSSSYVGSNYQSRSRRTTTSSRYSVYSASKVISGTSSPIYGESSGNKREQYSRNEMLDHRGGYRSKSRSPSEAYSRPAPHSRSRSPIEEYSHKRSHYSKAGPSNPSHEKTGWFGRAKNKIGNMFHRHRGHHHHPRDTNDVSASREDGNARAHRRSNTGNPGNNVVLRCQRKEQKVTKNTRRTPVKEKQGHLKKLTGGLFSHFWGSKKSKPSTAAKRRLERTVTGKGKVTAKKLDWLENINRKRLPRGTKNPKSKGGNKPNNKLKKLL